MPTRRNPLRTSHNDMRHSGMTLPVRNRQGIPIAATGIARRKYQKSKMIAGIMNVV
jgi:hypothetical protein